MVSVVVAADRPVGRERTRELLERDAGIESPCRAESGLGNAAVAAQRSMRPRKVQCDLTRVFDRPDVGPRWAAAIAGQRRRFPRPGDLDAR